MSDNPTTFRDFAGALMADDMTLAAGHLEVLLGVSADVARSGAEHFRSRIQSDAAFMTKAMGMRQVVQTGTREELVELLGECFSLEPSSAASAAHVVWKQFRSS